MNRTDDPKKQPIPFGVNGPREDIGPTTPTGDNSASYNSGFPPITMLLKSAGGLPPKGQDMNQILYELSSLARWTSAGALNVFDSTFSSSISGYPKGAVLSNSTFTGCWLNTVEANAANPENTDGTLTGWVPAFAYGTTALAGLAAANVTLTALQAANERITLAGTLTANINLVLPAWRKSWTIVNNCTGPFSVNCKTPSGTGIAVAAGATARIIGDGTNIISNESPLITGALQKSANLSDLTNVPAALSNLGLGMRGTAVFTSTATWTCPAGVTTVYIDACGGGGGGAYGTLNATGGGGGGGAQAVRRSAINVSPGQTYTITIGLGGVAGVTGAVDGGNGGVTSLGSLISLAGGVGGKNNGTGSAPGGSGGTYGVSGNYTSSLSFGGPGGQCIFGSSGPSGNGIQVGQGGGGYGTGGGGGAGGQAGGGGANGWMQIWW
ncbi:TPA: hypothetical protein ACHYPN_004538 [Yersinia enterocolitica]